jgi:uncharacterized membrane protein YfhO
MKQLSIFIILLVLLIFGLFYPIPFHASSITGNYGDIYKHYYPLKHLVAEHIIAGKMPFWNHYIFAGQPLLANPQSAVFYPISILFCVFPLVSSFNTFFMLHFFLAGIFMYLLLKNSRLSNTSTIIGTLAYCFSSFLVSKVPAGHPVAFSGYIWLPLIMLFSESLVSGRSSLGIYALALTLTFQFLSGHTFPVFITIIYFILFLIFNFKHIFKPYCISFMAAFLLSCAQFIPTYELSQYAETGNWLGLAQNYSLPIKNLINFILPNHFGNIFDHTFIFPLNPSYFFESHSLYIGLIPLLLGISGLYIFVKRKQYFYPVLLLSGVFLALGYNNPFYSFLYNNMPGFNYLRVPARFIYLTIAALAVLSAYAWDYFSVRLHTILKLLVVFIVIFDLFHWGKRYIYPEDMNCYEQKSGLADAFKPDQRILTEPDTINPNKSMLYHHLNLNGYEAIFLKDFTRYLGLQEKYALNSTGICRTDLFAPLSSGFSLKYIVSTRGEPGLRPVAGLNGVYEANNYVPRAYFPKRLKYISQNEPDTQIQYLQNTTHLTSQEVMLNTELGLPDNYSPNARVLAFGTAEDKVFVEAEAASPSVLVLADNYYNGWHAAAGGHKISIFRVNKVFLGICLPAGKYTDIQHIVYYFLPASFILGLFISLLSASALYLIILLSLKKISDDITVDSETLLY